MSKKIRKTNTEAKNGADKAPDTGSASGNGKTPRTGNALAQGSREQDVAAPNNEKLCPRFYEKELKKLHVELVRLQDWIRYKDMRVVIVFEGRDAAGKGGAIKRITEPLNPRFCRVVALGAPTDREKSQWYFQRYVAYLPGAGEMVLFDRSWYNRAGVERVMGFCDDAEYNEFSRSCPEFERMLIRSGINLVKYWFSISDEEQQRRFHSRLNTPTKHWKLSPMDLESIARWEDYSRAKDEMFAFSDIPEAPWHVVHADDKKRARLNCISHLLSVIPYESVPKPAIELPVPKERSDYVRPPLSDQRFVPSRY